MKAIVSTAFYLIAYSMSASADMTRTAPVITGDAVVKSTIGLAGPGPPGDGESEGIHHIQWMVSDTASGPFAPLQGVTGPRCVMGVDLIQKWIKAQITTTAAAGIPGHITETKPVQVRDRPGNPNVDFMAKNPLGLSFTFDREYIKRCAANATEGIQKGADGREESWDETIAGFDVDTFARDVRSTGAGYVIFALGQNSGYYCSPNAAIEKAAGCAPHTCCSKRDLPLEIMRALKAGNPACAITLNEGGKMRTPCPYIDMTDGESNSLGPVPKRGRWADPVNRVQWFIYTFIGANDPEYAGWGNKGVSRTASDLDAWLGLVFARGGAVTLDVKVNRFGRIDPEQLKLLKDTPACHGKCPKLDPNLFNDDNEAIAYAGNWVAYGGRDGDYEGDVHATDRNGDSFTFTFEGSGVEMFGEKNVDLGEIALSLDGQPTVTVDCKADTKSTRQSLFVSRNLPQGAQVDGLG